MLQSSTALSPFSPYHHLLRCDCPGCPPPCIAPPPPSRPHTTPRPPPTTDHAAHAYPAPSSSVVSRLSVAPANPFPSSSHSRPPPRPPRPRNASQKPTHSQGPASGRGRAASLTAVARRRHHRHIGLKLLPSHIDARTPRQRMANCTKSPLRPAIPLKRPTSPYGANGASLPRSSADSTLRACTSGTTRPACTSSAQDSCEPWQTSGQTRHPTGHYRTRLPPALHITSTGIS